MAKSRNDNTKRDKISIVVGHGDKGVPADSFVLIIERTLELVHGLDGSLAPGSENREWTISKISINSPLHLEMVSAKREGVISTGRALAGDLARLQRGDRQKYIPDELRDSVFAMYNIIGRGVSSIEISCAGARVVATEPIPKPIDETLSMSPKYSEVGSIEGPLEIASVRGGDNVKVYDSRFGCPVECAVSKRQFEEALGYLRKRSRVVVRGVIKFVGNRPKEISEVFDIRELPGPKERISIHAIRPIDLTGGKEPALHLRGND